MKGGGNFWTGHRHEWTFLGHTRRDGKTGPLYSCECGNEKFQPSSHDYFEIESEWDFRIGRLWFVWAHSEPWRTWRDRVFCRFHGHAVKSNGTDPERAWWCPTCGKVWPSHGHVACKMVQKPSGRGEI